MHVTVGRTLLGRTSQLWTGLSKTPYATGGDRTSKRRRYATRKIPNVTETLTLVIETARAVVFVCKLWVCAIAVPIHSSSRHKAQGAQMPISRSAA